MLRPRVTCLLVTLPLISPFYERIRSDGIPTGFESQSTIICEDQLSALMMSDFDDEIRRNIFRMKLMPNLE